MSDWIEGYHKEPSLYRIVDEDDEFDIVLVFDVGNYYSDGSMAYQMIGDDEQYYQSSSIKRYKVFDLEGEN